MATGASKNDGGSASSNANGSQAIAIMRFDDRNRYGVKGIPSSILFGDNSRTWVVNCKRPTKKNCWAKVKILDSVNRIAELVDILGHVGDYATELNALQWYFHVLPCRYPKTKKPSEDGQQRGLSTSTTADPDVPVEDCTSLKVFSVDDISTLDVDDALSLQRISSSSFTLGIHVANVARKISTTSELFQWAQERGASAYSGGIQVAEGSHKSSGSTATSSASVPMLPPKLAHDELSLLQDQPRHALTLWLTIEKDGEGKFQITSKRHSQTLVINRQKTTYEHWNTVTSKEDPYLVECRQTIQALTLQSGDTNNAAGGVSAEDLVAWTMVQYNTYFGELLAHKCSGGNHGNHTRGLLRAQSDVEKSAEYVYASQNPTAMHHASLHLDYYAHCSSPIRRFCDLWNQHVLLSHDANRKEATTMQLDLPRYNDRCAELKRYHATVDTMELAYVCRQAAKVFTGRVEISGSDDDYGGKSLLVYTPKRRVRVPLKDSYFAEPIVDAIEQATKDKDGNVTLSIELCGVLVAGRTRLRGRLMGVNAAPVDHNPSDMTSPPPHVQLSDGMVAVGKKESPHGNPPPGLASPPGLAVSPELSPPPGIAAPPGLAPPPGIAAPLGLTKAPAEAETPVPTPHPQENNYNNSTIGNTPAIENSHHDELYEDGIDDEDVNIDLDEVTQKQERHLPEAAQAWINSHNEMLKLQANSPANIDLMEACKLDESTVNQVLGYNIDEFQQRCLEVIVNPDQDLMAMAPTGSGKTAVALMAILQSFARNKRAFYTSPIKALSNQKYSEFTEWFAGRGIDAHVTLLTGDVKIRAPPGATNELIICTSEILRNKLIKASGGDHGSTSYIANAAREAASKGDQAAQQALDIMIREGYISETQDNQELGDPDLERLGCVVSDEIHYINDVERGVVWEETLMHLPKDVQSVALSATLRHPEKFVEWIESVRSRTGKLVIRIDRHVPLHVGGLDPKTNDLLEFYGTHKDVVANRSAGEFDTQLFHQLFSRKALENKNSISADTTRMAQKDAARGGRDAELQAQRDAFAGGGGRGGGTSGGRGGGRGGGGGGRGRGGSSASNSNNKGPPKVNFGHECIQLASSLDKVDKLPGIVFCMSRRMCVQGAHACKSLNLLLGKKGPKKPSEEEGIFALQQWEAEEHVRQTKVRTIERKRAQMHRQHLQKFMQEPYNLGDLEAYQDIEQLLSRGVAYHHGGMLPILREYVELCFQQRLVRLVFATETLAVGVNMPARTVVFSQVDKPDENSSGGAGGSMAHRWLRVDEFWQMAGRAGRRGLDVVGYVLYAPTLSVAGLKNIAPVHEFNRMLVGQVAPATSQLVVDRPFVLRHLLRGHDVSILSKTLKSDEMRRQNIVALERFSLEQNSTLSAKAEEQMKGFERFDEIEATLSGKGGIGGLKIKLSQKQQKKLMAEQRAIINEYPGGMVAFRAAKTKAGEAQRTLQEIETKESLLKSTWNRHLDWLIMAGFVKDDGRNTLTPRGTCAAAFSDGEPLIMGTVIADGGLKKLNIKEICAWICLFIPYRASGDYPALPENPVTPSQNLLETVEYSDSLAQQLGREDPLERTLMYLMLDWLTHKDLTRIATITDPHLLGGFVKAVMRVLSYSDMIRQVLLGLGDYETHNTLDHHADALLGGLVTNESLYLHMH